MFRNERDLLKSLRKAVMNYDWFDITTPEETIKPLNKTELKELESYRDTDGLLNFTKIKDMDLLARLVNNVERKNALEEMELSKTNPSTVENEGSMQDYVASLVDELLPLMGLKEAHVSVDTPAGKAKIDVKHGEEPKIVYEISDNECKDTSLTYTVKDENDVTTELEYVKDVEPVSVEEIESEHLVVPEDEVIDLELNDECDNRVVKLFECGFPHNPQYYHAVKHICEIEHFPYCGVYGRDDFDAPSDIDVAIILPNVWGKIAGCDVECFMSMIEEDGIDVYVIDPEDYYLKKIESPFDLLEYEMTPQQEEVMFGHE